jgi:hypothetical protein
VITSPLANYFARKKKIPLLAIKSIGPKTIRYTVTWFDSKQRSIPQKSTAFPAFSPPLSPWLEVPRHGGIDWDGAAHDVLVELTRRVHVVRLKVVLRGPPGGHGRGHFPPLLPVPCEWAPGGSGRRPASSGRFLGHGPPHWPPVPRSPKSRPGRASDALLAGPHKWAHNGPQIGRGTSPPPCPRYGSVRKKVRSERGVCLGQGRALDKGGGGTQRATGNGHVDIKEDTIISFGRSTYPSPKTPSWS